MDMAIEHRKQDLAAKQSQSRKQDIQMEEKQEIARKKRQMKSKDDSIAERIAAQREYRDRQNQERNELAEFRR